MLYVLAVNAQGWDYETQLWAVKLRTINSESEHERAKAQTTFDEFAKDETVVYAMITSDYEGTMKLFEDITRAIHYPPKDMAEFLLLQMGYHTEPSYPYSSMEDIILIRMCQRLELSSNNPDINKVNSVKLYSQNVIFLSIEEAEEYYNKIKRMGDVNSLYYQQVFKKHPTIDFRSEQFTSFQKTLETVYTSIKNPTILYNDFEIWACVYLYTGVNMTKEQLDFIKGPKVLTSLYK